MKKFTIYAFLNLTGLPIKEMYV